MPLMWNLISALNLVLCIIIVILAFLVCKKNKNQASIYIGLAFALFGISHMLSLFRTGQGLESTLIVVRVVAYILVIVALYKTAF